MSSSPSPPPPPAWPIVATGGAGVAVLLAAVLAGELAPLIGVLGSLVVGAVAVAATLRIGHASQRRFDDVMRAAQARVGEPPPFAALINALPDPILVISATEPDDLTSRRYVFANSAARDMLRLERGQGLVVSAMRDPALLTTMDRALFAGEDAEMVYETGGAQARTFKAYARPLGLALDGRRLALLAFRDETDIRRVERTRSDFLANASHELRTPLASLTGFIETLRGHARDDAGARDRFLGIMQAQAGRMARLIEDLMSLSRIELNEHIPPAEVVDVGACLKEVLEAVTPLAQERSIRIESSLPPQWPARVSGDRDQIVQVVQNLVDNALKYTPDGGAVRVDLATGLNAEAALAPLQPGRARLPLLTPDLVGQTYAVLRVSDVGPGIARENLPRLTERFYRVEGQKSGERSGTGLGLAIVKHIINRHRGGLAVESAPGEGATFIAYLPMTPVAEPVRPAVVKAS